MGEVKEAVRAILLENEGRLFSASDLVLLLQGRSAELPEDKSQAWHLVAGLRYDLDREGVSR